MYENPQTVVLPEKTKMDNIISATLYLLSTGTWKANAFPYADIVQKASTPLDIIYCLDILTYHAADNFLERAETVGELTLAAATCYGEIELEAPAVLVVGCLDGWEDGDVGCALEVMGC